MSPVTATTRINQQDDSSQPIEEIVFDVEIHFAWVDEDGVRVSPIHNAIGSALNFITDWNEKVDRIERQAERTQAEYERDVQRYTTRGDAVPEHLVQGLERKVQKINEAKEKLTRSGKPPARLARLVTKTTVEPLTDVEQQMAEVMHKAEFEEQS